MQPLTPMAANWGGTAQGLWDGSQEATGLPGLHGPLRWPPPTPTPLPSHQRFWTILPRPCSNRTKDPRAKAIPRARVSAVEQSRPSAPAEASRWPLPGDFPRLPSCARILARPKAAWGSCVLLALNQQGTVGLTSLGVYFRWQRWLMGNRAAVAKAPRGKVTPVRGPPG